VSETSSSTLGKILAFAAVVEVGTGLAPVIDPVLVVALLVGEEVSGVGKTARPMFRERVGFAETGVSVEPEARRERLA
jgi:hypothetical protein